jgi:hypothetical protein
MANWTANITAAVTDTISPNITATITLTNSVTNEIQTRSFSALGMTPNQIKVQADTYIEQLVARDAAFPAIKAAADASFILSTG